MERGEVLKRYCGWKNQATLLKRTPKDKTCIMQLVRYNWIHERVLKCQKTSDTHRFVYQFLSSVTIVSLVLKDDLTGTQAGAGFVSTRKSIILTICICACVYMERENHISPTWRCFSSVPEKNKQQYVSAYIYIYLSINIYLCTYI